MLNCAEYAIKWVTLPWERDRAYALRRRVFCQEQGLFEHDDLDDIDQQARLLVALSVVAGWHDEVVGTVRIHEQRPGIWFGSRLAVDESFRRQGQLGPALIRLAVSSANAVGCREFYARVQQQNEPLFKRMHWRTLDVMLLRGVPHVLMQAELAHYPPCYDPLSGMVLAGRTRRVPLELAPSLTGAPL
jgi:putative N-acetyltransferase (TIGR04045 family)